MTPGLLVAAVVLVPLGTAAATAMTAKSPRAQRALSFLGLGLFALSALDLLARTADGIVIHLAFGNWALPMGIGFTVDRLAAVLLVLAALMGAAALLFEASAAGAGARGPTVLPLMHGLLAGVAGAFATADLFNLYVWFEVMLVCALGLLAAGARRDQLDATLRYLGMNLVGTVLLLLAIGLWYGATGALAYPALHHAARQLDPALRTGLVAALGLALLLKAAAFPLAAWMPAAYPALPAASLALIGGLLSKVAVYALMRLGGEVFAPLPESLRDGLGWLAVATMITGVLGAAYHWDLRRILVFHSVSQVGYILLALALGTMAGAAAAVFYILHHSVVKAGLYLVAGTIGARSGSHDLRHLGGLAVASPGLATVFALLALSLIGIPPLTGFWAKLLVLQATFGQERWVWGTAALAVSVLTLYSMMKIWIEAFWKPHPSEWAEPGKTAALTAPWWPAWLAMGLLAALSLGFGLWPQDLIGFPQASTTGYIRP
ncbi:MAG: proton-conducting transporter membrane subunit [Tibeticola sp.]